MNFFKLTLVTVSLLLIGCGSDSKSSSSDKQPNDTKVESVKDAQKTLRHLQLLVVLVNLLVRLQILIT